MRKYRFFSQQSMQVGKQVLLDESLAHYITRVLRLNVGEVIYLFNNTGIEFCAQITQANKNRLNAVISAAESSHTESPLDLHLALALIKFDKIDLILQKSCELGVSRISLIATQYTSIKNAYQRALEKAEHWQKILESAAAQCGRSSIPELQIVPKLEEFFTQTDHASLKIILDPRAINKAQLTHPQQAITILIGPEGGFSDPEVELASLQNFSAMNLGPRILRTETACFCALTILQAEYGDLLC